MDSLHPHLPADALPPDGGVCPEAHDIHPRSHDGRLYHPLLPDPTPGSLAQRNTRDLRRGCHIAVDSTGDQGHEPGEWMREKWRVRRGWIKVHAMIDVETNQIPSLEVTDEAVPDDRMFVPLLDQVQQHCGEEHPVYRVLGDGAYDRKEFSNALEQRKILTGSSLESRSGWMQQPTRPGHPIVPSASENGSDWGYRMWSWITTSGMRWKSKGSFSTPKGSSGKECGQPPGRGCSARSG